MPDTTEKLGHTLIQHGPGSNRIYVMSLSHLDMPGIIDTLDRLAKKNSYTKIFVRAQEKIKIFFEKAGYSQEAYIPGFYNLLQDASFLAKYFSKDRSKNKTSEETEANIKTALSKSGQVDKPVRNSEYTFRKAAENDAGVLASIYKEVFKSYPFPIFDPAYIKKTMRKNIVYFLALDKDENPAAASSAEVSQGSQTAEMTDFATLPAHLGNSLALFLLRKMEKEMKEMKILTLYTIARSMSPGMNITFSKNSYKFAGTLINNTNIAGKIENMNVWYKHI